MFKVSQGLRPLPLRVELRLVFFVGHGLALAARADHVQVALVPHPDDADAAPLLPLACPPALAAKVRGALAPPEADVALFLFASKTGRLLSADGVDGVTTRGVAFLDDWAEKSHFMMVV